MDHIHHETRGGRSEGAALRMKGSYSKENMLCMQKAYSHKFQGVYSLKHFAEESEMNGKKSFLDSTGQDFKS